VEFWWNPIILLMGDVSLRYLSKLEMVSVDVREVIVAGWWCGWELCSELGSFGSTGMGDCSVRIRRFFHERLVICVICTQKSVVLGMKWG